MRLGGRRSSNIEDRRGVRLGRTGGLGLGTLVIALIALYFGQDPSWLLQISEQAGNVGEQSVPYEESPSEARARELVSVVLADTEDTWTLLMADAGTAYPKPKLVLFRDAVRSACGTAQAAMGPFYCPADQRIYIDLGFYDELRDRFGAPGDFAQAYVVAHEVGHHVQHVLGISTRVRGESFDLSRARANELSVRQELQADCFAGIWAHHANRSRRVLEAGDLEEALDAASAIGDDRLTAGRAPPESFTHGTSEQRARWFERGFDAGAIADCDTFGASSL